MKITDNMTPEECIKQLEFISRYPIKNINKQEFAELYNKGCKVVNEYGIPILISNEKEFKQVNKIYKDLGYYK